MMDEPQVLPSGALGAESDEVNRPCHASPLDCMDPMHHVCEESSRHLIAW